MTRASKASMPSEGQERRHQTAEHSNENEAVGTASISGVYYEFASRASGPSDLHDLAPNGIDSTDG